jgi:hypothetical protein
METYVDQGQPLDVAARASFASRISSADREALVIWAFTRLAVLSLSWPAMLIMHDKPKPWLQLWQNWDALMLQSVAQHGYFAIFPNQVAFLPGYPLALLVVHLIVHQWVISELLLSFIAGAFAMVALGRIAGDSRAVLYILVSPAAIFLAVGYTEALFLAFALWAWLAASDSHWWLAAMLAGLASVVRINGVFLCLALLVYIALNAKGRRLRAFLTFVPAFMPVLGYEIYLRVTTGDWLAWFHAESLGWGRHLASPVAAYERTWGAAFGHRFNAPGSFPFQLELVAAAVGVAILVVLIVRRSWPEVVYVGLTIGSLITSVWYESVPRSLLLLWPLWAFLAAQSAKRPVIGKAYLALSAPLAAAIALLYLSGYWAG